MTKRKKNNTNSTTQLKSFSTNYFDEYLDMTCLRTRPVTAQWVEALGLRLMNWAANDPKAYKVSQFYLSEGICNHDFERWMEKYEFFKHAVNFAVQCIGNRRESGGLERKFDSGIVRYTMNRYDKEWKKMAEFHQKFRNPEADPVQGIRVVEIEKIPNSDIVPEKPSNLTQVKQTRTPEEVARECRKKETSTLVTGAKLKGKI